MRIYRWFNFLVMNKLDLGGIKGMCYTPDAPYFTSDQYYLNEFSSIFTFWAMKHVGKICKQKSGTKQ